MQRPILKDRIVVNVIEIGEDTEIVTKSRHKELMAIEEADYARRAAAWRASVGERQLEVRQAAEKLTMAKMTLAAVKAQAGKAGVDATQLLKQILALDDEIAGHEKAVAELQAKPIQEKPRLDRGKRWFHPEGLEVGPAGGNIGDIWDGKAYTRPEKASREHEEAAQPVA
jgi:hypothetical protein